jgi:hypothetical protein
MRQVVCAYFNLFLRAGFIWLGDTLVKTTVFLRVLKYVVYIFSSRLSPVPELISKTCMYVYCTMITGTVPVLGHPPSP